jgi:hypothetical protein
MGNGGRGKPICIGAAYSLEVGEHGFGVSGRLRGGAVSSVQDKADVSAIFSVIRLIGLAPPNHLFAYRNADNVVLNAGRSFGTVTNLYQSARNQELISNYLDRNTADHGAILVGSSCLHWWRLADAVALSPMSVSREWREILNDIFDDLEYLHSDRHHAQQSINGVIGATNSRMRLNSPEELLAALIQRFESKIVEGGTFLELPHHPKFRDFLVQRVRKLRGLPKLEARGPDQPRF